LGAAHPMRMDIPKFCGCLDFDYEQRMGLRMASGNALFHIADWSMHTPAAGLNSAPKVAIIYMQDTSRIE